MYPQEDTRHDTYTTVIAIQRIHRHVGLLDSRRGQGGGGAQEGGAGVWQGRQEHVVGRFGHQLGYGHHIAGLGRRGSIGRESRLVHHFYTTLG